MGKFLAVASFHNKLEKDINNTFSNVLNQTHKDWILIVGDDFSSDTNFKRTLKRKVLELNDSRIIYYEVKKRRELYLLQNMFLEYDYDYFFDLDSDDILHPELFKIYNTHFEKYPEVFSIFSDYNLVDDTTGDLLQWSLVQEPENWLKEWNFRHTGEFWEIYSNRNTQKMYGCGRAMRRPEVKSLPILKECKTAMDTYFLFYNLSRGKHLNIPRNLYTYKQRPGSDSGNLTNKEFEEYNLNCKPFLDNFENYGKTKIYEDLWHVTSAISTCDWLDAVTEFSLFSDELTDHQKKKIKALYPDKNIIYNQEHENVVVSWTKKPSHNLPDYKRLSILTFNDATGEKKTEQEIQAYTEQVVASVNKWTKGAGNWYYFFRQNRLTHTKDSNLKYISLENGPKVEIIGDYNKKYFIEFIDSRSNTVVHSDTITNNMWTKCSREYYVPWIIKINGKVVHVLDLTNKKVKISFDSKSVGDTLAWIPQVLEFKNKYKCKVAVSTFHNEWFEGLEVYKDLEFVKPDTAYPAYAHYKIGWFRTDGKWDEGNKNPVQANTVPLIQAATDILGLPYKEVNYGVNFTPGERPIKQKYICIGPRSTAGLKEWPYQNWKELAKLLHKDGYKIVNLSYEGFEGPHIINKKGMGWEKTWNYLYHADLFIGLGSGLSWMNWALGKHTIMVNNFIPFGFEFTENLTKLENHSVCNNCWIKKEYMFDTGDWNWCPKNKGTNKQHICQKSITVDEVYEKSIETLNLSVKLNRKT